MRYLMLFAFLCGCSRESSPKEGPSADLSESPFVEVTQPVYRFSWPSSSPEQVAIRFRIRGDADSTAVLGNGEVRHQFGIMLRAKNECNLVYAMLRLSEHKVVVQEKTNLDMSTHEECKNNGYTTVVPTETAVVPEIKLNKSYELSAQILDDEMQVHLSDQLIWRGPAPEQNTGGNEVGVRSDNIRVGYRVVDSPEN